MDTDIYAFIVTVVAWLVVFILGYFQRRSRSYIWFRGVSWSEREDLNLRPLVSQTSALTGLRHAPMPFP